MQRLISTSMSLVIEPTLLIRLLVLVESGRRYHAVNYHAVSTTTSARTGGSHNTQKQGIMGGKEHTSFGLKMAGGNNMISSSKKYIEITCTTCGKKVMKRSDFVANVHKEGRKIVCSRLCAVPHRKPSVYKSLTLGEYSGKNSTSVCQLCKLELPIDEFIKEVDNKHQKFRKSWFCSKCRVVRKREYYLKSKYNMFSIDEYDTMLRDQDCKCAICSKDMDRPCVDHNHTTGKIRKLLCVQCNAMIGNSYEDISTLKNAIKYLEDN